MEENILQQGGTTLTCPTRNTNFPLLYILLQCTLMNMALLYPPPLTFACLRCSFVSTVERYNPQENRWHTVSPMGTRRKHLGCAVYQDMIYSVGGRDDTTELSSAERYNPRTNQWSPVVAMTSRRSGVSLDLLH